MKGSHPYSSAFSLVEVTLALGVAAFSLLIILGMLPVSLKTNQASTQQTNANGIISQIAADLRAAARLPPGQVSKQFSLHPHNGGPWDPTPDYIYFTDDVQPTELRELLYYLVDTILDQPAAAEPEPRGVVQLVQLNA